MIETTELSRAHGRRLLGGLLLDFLHQSQERLEIICRLALRRLEYLVFLRRGQPPAETGKVRWEVGSKKTGVNFLFHSHAFPKIILAHEQKDDSHYLGTRWPLEKETQQITGILFTGLGCLQRIHMLAFRRSLAREHGKEWNFSFLLLGSPHASFLSRSEGNGVIFKHCVSRQTFTNDPVFPSWLSCLLFTFTFGLQIFLFLFSLTILYFPMSP